VHPEKVDMKRTEIEVCGQQTAATEWVSVRDLLYSRADQ
jgi:hypothetical protein